MNRQGIQMAINAIYKVIHSAPKPYTSRLYPHNLNSDILPQQFENWINYLYSILDIAYRNLGISDFMMEKNKIMQIVQRSILNNPYAPHKMHYLTFIDQINKELFAFIQYLLQY